MVRDQTYADFSPSGRFLFLASPAFDASTFEIWGALLNGGRCIIHNEAHLDLDQLERTFAESGANTAWLTAGLFNLIVDTKPEMLAKLEHVLTGGEALSPRHVRMAIEALPRLKLTNGYGPTECTTFACTHAIQLEDVGSLGPYRQAHWEDPSGRLE